MSEKSLKNSLITIVKQFLKAIFQPVILKYPIIILIILFIFGFMFFLLAIFFGKATLIEFLLTAMPQKNMVGVNILAAGIDETDGVQRSDTIIVLHIGESNYRVGVLSIPRDTLVMVDGIGQTKINHAYAYGKMPLLQKTVSQFLKIPIHYYIRLDLKGLETMIDKLGGLTFNVDKRMYYVDKSGDLYIDLKPGEQKLSGKDAVAYLRYRHDLEGDIGRIKRQQNFLKETINRMSDSTDFVKAPTLFRQLNRNFESNLSIRELIGLAMFIHKATKIGNIITGTIPGEPALINHISYWQPHLIETDKIVSQILLGLDQQESTKSRVITVDKKASKSESRRKITLPELNRAQETIELTQNKAQDQQTQKIAIEVLNGSGGVGIARDAAKLIKRKGFKVVWFGNAGSFDYTKTCIVAWKGDVQNIVMLANVLNINPAQIIIYHKPNKKIDATVVIGKDWPSLQKKK